MDDLPARNVQACMSVALRQARRALVYGELPVGAAVFSMSGHVLSKAHNQTETLQDFTAHAELLSIQKACKKLGTKYLSNCFLATTLEPCDMCWGAIELSRIKVTYFGAFRKDKKASMSKPEVYGGICEDECSELLKEFFQTKRLTSR